MDTVRKALVKQNAKVLNSTINNDELLDLTVDLVLDRVLLYLNVAEIDKRLDKVISQMVASFYPRQAEISATGQAEAGVASISDNGQSIHYSDGPKRFMGTVDDEALFSGFERLLKPYRGINVVS